VVYEILKTDGDTLYVDNPAKLPPSNEISELREPIITANILVPPEHVGAVLKLCTDKRGRQKKMQYLGNQVSLQYELPMADVVLDFFDRLKSVSRGYASFDYEFSHFEPAPMVKLDVLINGDKVDASLKAEIEAAVATAKTAVEGGDPEAMREQANALQQVAMKLGQAIYEKEQAAQASPGAEGPAKDDDVVDAEFSEVDDNKA